MPVMDASFSPSEDPLLSMYSQDNETMLILPLGCYSSKLFCLCSLPVKV